MKNSFNIPCDANTFLPHRGIFLTETALARAQGLQSRLWAGKAIQMLLSDEEPFAELWDFPGIHLAINFVNRAEHVDEVAADRFGEFREALGHQFGRKRPVTLARSPRRWPTSLRPSQRPNQQSTLSRASSRWKNSLRQS